MSPTEPARSDYLTVETRTHRLAVVRGTNPDDLAPPLWTE